MDWKDYINNHKTIIKNSKRLDISGSLIKNSSDLGHSKKRGNFILRQELKSLTIFCSFKVSLIFNLILFTIFNIIGIFIAVSSQNIKEIIIRYDDW